MQLSEMEEEMDQRIHAAERKTRDQVSHTQTQVYKTYENAQRWFFLKLLLNIPGFFWFSAFV